MGPLQSLRHPRALLPVLLLFTSISAQGLRGGEDGIHPQRNSTSQVRALQFGRFSLSFQNLGAFLTSMDADNGHLVSSAGVLIAGKEQSTGELRASLGLSIDQDNQPGTLKNVYTGGSSTAADPNDPTFRIYAIQRSDTAAGSSDYQQWPIDQGAPVRPDGKPLLLGEKQFFYVYNDLRMSGHPGRGQPMGIEVRVLGWWDNATPLPGGTIFLRFQIVNRSIFTYDSVYVGIWSDPDLGEEYHWDLVGCDTTLRLFFDYHDIEQDHATYGINPPAVGFQFLDVRQPGGPAGYDLFRFVPIRRCPPEYCLLLPELYEGAAGSHQQAYDYLRGLGYLGTPVINPLTGEASTRVASGDPVTSLGWLPKDSGILPTDIRMMGSTGPSRLAPGDTQTVTAALIVAQGQDRLGSLAQLRFDAERILESFTSPGLLPPTVKPDWWMEYGAGALPKAHLQAATTGIQSCTAEFFDADGQKILTSPMAGGGVFTTVAEIPPAERPGFADLVAQTTTGKEIRYRGAFNRLSTAARPALRNFHVIHDQANGDGVVNPGEEIEFTISLLNGSALTFDSLALDRAYPSSATLLTRTIFRGVRPGEECTAPGPLAVIIDPSTGGTDALLPYVLTENVWSNRWLDTLRIPVQPFNFTPEKIYPVHVSGNATRTPAISLVNPSAWRDHQYALSFPSADSVRIVDLSAGDTLLPNRFFSGNSPAIPEADDACRLVIDGFKILPWSAGTEVTEIREYFGPGGIALESEPHEQAIRLGRDLRHGRANSTNRYAVRIRYDFYSGPPVEIRATERGSRYYLGPGPGNIIRLAADRMPFEIWDLEATPDDPSDDVRLTVLVVDADSNRHFTAGERITGTPNFPYSETPQDSWRFEYYSHRDITLNFAPTPGGQFELPEVGTVLRVYPAIHPASGDLYLISPATALIPPPESIRLYNNFPNPFNPATTIKFYLPRKSRVEVRVFDLLGAEVGSLLDEERDAGIQYAFWNGKNGSGRPVASGVYLYRVMTPSGGTAGKMVLLR